MESKILVVGCGGLGCELAKLLSMEPTNRLTFVDDDTIDSTNLNLQFIFTKEDIGKSKAQVLCEKIKTEKRAEYVFGKIDQFKSLEFYRQFDVVYNCLDNDEARSFVNERCYVAKVKMVDGGSAGWLGQSFYNGKECFACLPKRLEKVYPVCTIRQRPKNFEHCLVWAKAIVEGKSKESLEEEIAQSLITTNEGDITENQSLIATNEDPSLIITNEDPSLIITNEDPSLIITNEDPSLIITNEDPSLIITNEDPSLIITNEDPSLIITNEDPSLIATNDDPSLIADDEIILVNNDVSAVKTHLISNVHIEKADDMKNDVKRARYIDDFEYLVENEDPILLTYDLAKIKAERFSIEPISFIDSQTFLKKIIPSICTTNSIIASLMILSAQQEKNFYLVQGSLTILRTELNEKKKDCLVCSLPTYLVEYPENCTVAEFLAFFKGECLISDICFFDQKSDQCLLDFNESFLIVIKNETKNRVYFTKENKLAVKRIR